MSAASLALSSKDSEGTAFFGSRLVFAVRGVGLGAVGRSFCGAGPLARLASTGTPDRSPSSVGGLAGIWCADAGADSHQALGHLPAGGRPSGNRSGNNSVGQAGRHGIRGASVSADPARAHADSMVCQNLCALENLERPQAAASAQFFALALGPQAQASGEIAGHSRDDGLRRDFTAFSYFIRPSLKPASKQVLWQVF